MSVESDFLPDITYMDRQPELSKEMRAILVDWIVEIHYKFKLLPETLFITVNLIDRYLCTRVVNKKNF